MTTSLRDALEASLKAKKAEFKKGVKQKAKKQKQQVYGSKQSQRKKVKLPDSKNVIRSPEAEPSFAEIMEQEGVPPAGFDSRKIRKKAHPEAPTKTKKDQSIPRY